MLILMLEIIVWISIPLLLLGYVWVALYAIRLSKALADEIERNKAHRLSNLHHEHDDDPAQTPLLGAVYPHFEIDKD